MNLWGANPPPLTYRNNLYITYICDQLKQIYQNQWGGGGVG